MRPLKISLVGAGAMASNHARIISEAASVVQHYIFDVDSAKSNALSLRFGFKVAENIHQLLESDAVVIASTTSAHFDNAMFFIENKKPVLIEKPLSIDYEEVEKLCFASSQLGVPLYCGFVERFNPAFETAMDQIDGDPIQIATVRHSPFNPRASSSVVYDLLIHDVDLLLKLATPYITPHVSAKSLSPGNGSIREAVDCIVSFNSELNAVLSASRLGQRKIRTLAITTENALIEADLLRGNVTTYKNLRQEQPDDTKNLIYRSVTTIDIPFVRHSGEPLMRQFEYFLSLVNGDYNMNTELKSILESHKVAQLIEDSCEIS